MCYRCGMSRPRATRLRIALVHAEMTQTELAGASGIERTRLSRIVNGLHCDEATRQKIADALRRNVSELFPSDEQEGEAA